jgi:serine protease
MNTTRLRASLAACLAAGAIVAMSWPETVVWGAPLSEAQRQRQGGQVTPPRDAVPRGQAAPASPRFRVSLDRAARLVDASNRGLDYVPGEVIVRFRSLTTPAARQRALGALRGQPELGGLEWHGPVAIVRDLTQPDAHVLADQLSRQPEVMYAEPNYIVRLSPTERAFRTEPAADGLPPSGAPNDEDYATYQWNLSLLNMPGAWDIQPGGTPDVIVAVLDTGITTSTQSQTFRIWTGSAFENVPMAFAPNPDLSSARLADPFDFAFQDTTAVLDMDGHGTHVSSTIGEDTNNVTLAAGLAYNVRIMPVKVCRGYWEELVIRALTNTTGFPATNAGGCPIVDIADGIRYAADRGARVMNLSLAGTGTQATIQDALNYAVSRGAFVAIAMGNNFNSGNPVMYPARYAQDIMGVMSVGAVNKSQTRASYSSTGAHAEIAAPGGQFQSGTDQGVIWQSTLFPPDYDPGFLVRRPRFDHYDSIGYQGTSMATPHVAGLAALIISQSPGISPANVERAIRATARDIGQPGKDDEFGYGLIQPRNVLFGWGLRK